MPSPSSSFVLLSSTTTPVVGFGRTNHSVVLRGDELYVYGGYKCNDDTVGDVTMLRKKKK